MKVKMAIGLGATCAGCDMAILDLAEKILDLAELADIVFWPTGMDFKFTDLEKFKEGEIDISLYHGTVRTSEHEHTAHMLREKSKAFLAFGSCSCFGGIPGLCNTTTKEEIFRTAYRDTPSTVNPKYVVPRTDTKEGPYRLTLPELKNEGKSLSQIVDVDYFLPGCPPAVVLIEKLIPILEGMLEGVVPPKGTVIASDKTLCDECPLEKKNKSISRIRRIHTTEIDPERCLLEQGILCMGPGTRGGCGASCIQALMPCRGCMGPALGVKDQGAKMISAIASILVSENEKDISEKEVDEIIKEIKDPLGTFYRFTLPSAFINRKVQ